MIFNEDSEITTKQSATDRKKSNFSNMTADTKAWRGSEWKQCDSRPTYITIRKKKIEHNGSDRSQRTTCKIILFTMKSILISILIN